MRMAVSVIGASPHLGSLTCFNVDQLFRVKLPTITSLLPSCPKNGGYKAHLTATALPGGCVGMISLYAGLTAPLLLSFNSGLIRICTALSRKYKANTVDQPAMLENQFCKMDQGVSLTPLCIRVFKSNEPTTSSP